MMDMREIHEEIKRLERMPACYDVCRRLACLYIVREHAQGKDEDHAERRETHALSAEEAKRWVSGMIGTDPEHAHGGRWTIEEAQTLAQKIGWKLTDGEMPAFYAILNALYSDYAFVAKKYGVTQPEFYAELARAFLMDADARPGKAERYYRHIVQ